MPQTSKPSHLLAVIVPVYNERDRIADCISQLWETASRQGWKMELIVVDDGSDDGSVEVIRRVIEQVTEQVTERSFAHGNAITRNLSENPSTVLESRAAATSFQIGSKLNTEVKFIQHAVNQGKGAAIRTGLQQVCAPLVVIQDADLEYDPADLPRLLARMEDEDADVVYGSRCLPNSQNPRRHNLFAWGVSLLNLVVRRLYGVCLTDEATCYKMFRSAHVRQMDLQCSRFEFCPEVTAKACRMELRIVEVPISYWPRGAEEGKKIRLRDGWEALKTLWRYRRWEAEGPRESQPEPGEES